MGLGVGCVLRRRRAHPVGKPEWKSTISASTSIAMMAASSRRSIRNSSQAPPFLVSSDIALRSGYSYQWWDAKIPDCADCRVRLTGLGPRQKRTEWLARTGLRNPASDRDRPASIRQSKTLAALSATQGPSVPVEARARLSIPTSAGSQPQSMIAAAGAIKIAVKHEGWYRVTQPETGCGRARYCG